MMHILPRRKLNPGDIIDNEVLNWLIQPLVAKIAGGFNEHDFSGGLISLVSSIATDAYYSVYQSLAKVSMKLTSGGNKYPKQNSTLPTSATATVTDNPAWAVLADDVTGARVEKTISTGEDILFCLGQAQYVSWKGTGTDTAMATQPCRIQFALQLDGVTIDDTITGPLGMGEWPPQQVYKAKSQAPATDDYDYRHITYQKNNTGLGAGVGGWRLTYAIPVTEGSHTVSLAARRLPRADFQPGEGGDGSLVQVYNRQLAVIRLKGRSAFYGTGATFSASRYEDADVVSGSGLTTLFDNIRKQLNDLQESAVERGAFTNLHLPSIVTWSRCAVITPRATTAMALSGLVGSQYVAYGDPGGWQQVWDGAGNYLRIQNTVTLQGHAGVLVALANVQLDRTYLAATDEDDILGMFCLRYKDNAGNWNYLGETEFAFKPRNATQPISDPRNAPNEVPTAAGDQQGEIFEDVPLMWVVDTDALIAANPNATSIQEIEVMQCTHNMIDNRFPHQYTRRGVLSAYRLEGVTLA
jgi:hypothetical protein